MGFEAERDGGARSYAKPICRALGIWGLVGEKTSTWVDLCMYMADKGVDDENYDLCKGPDGRVRMNSSISMNFGVLI